MTPGPFSICKVDFPEDSDAAIYATLKHGYDTARQAFDDITVVGKESGVSDNDLAVIRFVDLSEADKVPGC